MTAIPRILHVFESWSPVVSGYVTRSRRIVEHQRADGIAEPVPLISSRQHMLADGKADGARVVTPSGRERLVRRLRPWDVDAGHLARAVAEAARDCDLVHGHFSSAIGHGAAQGARAAGRPFVSEVRFDLAGAMAAASGRALVTRAEPWLRRRFERHHQGAAAIVAASHSLGRLIGPLAPHVPLHVAPNGADMPDLAPGAGDVARGRLGVGANRVLVGTATNMLAYEGLDRLAPALAGRDDVTLLFVGDGPARAALEEGARRAGLPAIFTGRVPAVEVPALIAALDVFAIPRPPSTVTAYASPLKLAEAMAVGAAIVATDQGDMAHMLRDGHGIVVPAGDDAALSAGLRALADDPDRRAELRRLTRARARAEMRWSDTVALYGRVYAEVLS
jgi:glycosyltransferase involved in cell wall biosynthesis